MNRVVSLFAKSQDPKHQNMVEMLEQMLAQAKRGEFGENPRCMVMVWSQGEGMNTQFDSSGLTASQAIALLEVTKMRVFNERIDNA